ncbi:hypothetical protein Q1695_005537 [Nippostrongylus brasiliensis]|nr:hypothetical protein Q1695_005537 [Nippostrongylus brasiliensis]
MGDEYEQLGPSPGAPPPPPPPPPPPLHPQNRAPAAHTPIKQPHGAARLPQHALNSPAGESHRKRAKKDKRVKKRVSSPEASDRESDPSSKGGEWVG